MPLHIISINLPSVFFISRFGKGCLSSLDVDPEDQLLPSIAVVVRSRCHVLFVFIYLFIYLFSNIMRIFDEKIQKNIVVSLPSLTLVTQKEYLSHFIIYIPVSYLFQVVLMR